MTISETLYAAAKYMRGHGFSPAFKRDGACRCFLGAIESIDDDTCAGDYFGTTIFDESINSGWWIACRLRAQDWSTDDAVAALTIAADCAASEGK